MAKPQNHCALTFDMDWAPDWCIELCIEICLKHNICATFFVTHPTALLNAMSHEPRFELGIHPNFQPRSEPGGYGGTGDDLFA